MSGQGTKPASPDPAMFARPEPHYVERLAGAAEVVAQTDREGTAYAWPFLPSRNTWPTWARQPPRRPDHRGDRRLGVPDLLGADRSTCPNARRHHMTCPNGCGYECAACGRDVTWRDRDPSPAEVDHICNDCYESEIRNDAA